MWSSKSGVEGTTSVNQNMGNGIITNEMRGKKSEVSFSSKVMAEATEKLNNDLKVCD